MRCMQCLRSTEETLFADVPLLGEPRWLSADHRTYYVRWCVVQCKVCAVFKHSSLYFDAAAFCQHSCPVAFVQLAWMKCDVRNVVFVSLQHTKRL